MNLELLFALSSAAVLPAWLLLIFAPSWSWTTRIAHSIWIPALLAVLYLVVLLTSGPPPEGGSFFTLQGLVIFFSRPQLVLLGWIHFLAFDLFVGAWEARDAKRNEIPHAWLVPCLLCTYMLGPVGLLLYFGVRGTLRRTAGLAEQSAVEQGARERP